MTMKAQESQKFYVRAGDRSAAITREIARGALFVTEFRGKKIVAVRGYGPCDWAAYAGPVEWTDERVADRGDKIAEDLAYTLFPVFNRSFYFYRL